MARTLKKVSGHQFCRSSWTGKAGNNEPVPEDGYGMDRDWKVETIFAEHQERCQKEELRDEFQGQFLEWAKKEFGYDRRCVETHLVYGLARLPCAWGTDLFVMALLVGETLDLNQYEVRDQLMNILVD